MQHPACASTGGGRGNTAKRTWTSSTKPRGGGWMHTPPPPLCTREPASFATTPRLGITLHSCALLGGHEEEGTGLDLCQSARFPSGVCRPFRTLFLPYPRGGGRQGEDVRRIGCAAGGSGAGGGANLESCATPRCRVQHPPFLGVWCGWNCRWRRKPRSPSCGRSWRPATRRAPILEGWSPGTKWAKLEFASWGSARLPTGSCMCRGTP